MKYKKKKRVYILLLILLSITLGYALISTTLKINGIANVSKHTWKVYWQNPQVTEGSKIMTAPDISDDDNQQNTKATWNVSFDLPGEFYEFTIDAVNESDIDVMITDIVNTVTPALPSYVRYTFTYADGGEIEMNHKLAKASNGTPTIETYKVRVEYIMDEVNAGNINQIDAATYTYTFGITYGRADENAIDRGSIVPPSPTPVELDVGQYFTLVPDSTSYTINSSLTGYSDNQTINPSNLTLWRILSANQDGSYDAVSEYVSNETVCLKGETGYGNLVNALQTVAKKYKKSGYTIGTRMLGYDGQTLVISDWSSFDGTGYVDSTTSTPMATSGDGEEYADGVYGDTLYLKDYLLMKSVYGDNGLAGKKSSGDTTYDYWLASRRYVYNSGYDYRFTDSYIDRYGNLAGETGGLQTYTSSGFLAFEDCYTIRPVITLSPYVVISGGTGIKTDPYTFR